MLREQIRNDVVVVARVERDFFLPSAVGQRTDDVQRVIAIERGHFDGHDLARSRGRRARTRVKRHTSHRRLKIETEDRDDPMILRGNGQRSWSRLGAPQRGKAEQARRRIRPAPRTPLPDVPLGPCRRYPRSGSAEPLTASPPARPRPRAPALARTTQSSDCESRTASYERRPQSRRSPQHSISGSMCPGALIEPVLLIRAPTDELVSPVPRGAVCRSS